jgi:hypothetical protein
VRKGEAACLRTGPGYEGRLWAAVPPACLRSLLVDPKQQHRAAVELHVILF